MQQKMYSIRDSKADIYHIPFFKNTHGEAERDFSQIANDEKSTISKYPEDFDLYYVGEYDTSTGKIIPLDTPLHIQKAVFYKREKLASV